jgi:subtilisin family serine protease
MYHVRYGGKRGAKISLSLSKDMLVTRTKDARSLESAVSSRAAVQALGQCELVTRFEEAGVDVLRVTAPKSVKAKRDAVRQELRKQPDLRFAGRAVVDPKSQRPVLYTENFFVKFQDEVSTRKCKSILKAHGLRVKQQVPYASNAFFVAAAEGTGLEIFSIADALLDDEQIELCHPELLREVRRRGAFSQQWHLKKTTVDGNIVDQHANIEAAWQLSRGEEITIAVIDDGVDLDHEEFAGDGRIVSPRGRNTTVERSPARSRRQPRYSMCRCGLRQGATRRSRRCSDGQVDANPIGFGPRLPGRGGRIRLGSGSRRQCDILQLGPQRRSLVGCR